MKTTPALRLPHLFLCLSLAAGSVAAHVPLEQPAARAQNVFTPQRVAEIRNVSAAAISPDGSRVAYTLSIPRRPGEDEDGLPWTELWLAARAGGTPRCFVGGKSELSAVEWSADGRALAFLAKRGSDKANALYLLPLDGGEARRVAALEGGINAYSLAPDGKRVALVATEPAAASRKKATDKGFKEEVYEEDVRSARVWVANLGEEASARKLEIEGHVHAVRWSPVDERLLVSIAPTPLVDDEYMRQRVRVVDAASGQVLAAIENPGKLGALRWSPDGKWVGLISAADLHDPDAGRLCVASSQGGEPVDVLPGYLGDTAAFEWQGPTTILALCDKGVWSVLEKVEAVREGKPAPGQPAKTLLAQGGPVLTGFSLSKDGQHAAFVGSTHEHAAELFLMSHGEQAPRRVTDSNPWIATLELAHQELVQHEARDGTLLQGILIRPLGEQAGQRYPLLLYVHGGPEAHEQMGWQTGYSKPGQVAAARGFAVYHANYRGSTGRGVAFSKLGQGDPAGKEFDDLIDAVDHLVGMGLVDSKKVGITGGSYGGYATAWCATRYSERFAAGVMFVGISDKLSKVGTTDIPDEEYYVHALKRPWENWQFFLERSPIYHAERCRTPLLILHGKDDPRVNPGQSRELYRHLKVRRQAPVRLVLYPGEGHGNRKACARLDYNLRMLQWFEHYLQGPGGEAPAWEIEHFDLEAKKDS